MSDPLRAELAAELAALPEGTPEMMVSWPLSFEQVSLRSFVPFGLVSAEPPSFSTEWLFTYDAPTASLFEVRAMFTGLITWMPAESILRLESFHHPSEMLNLLDEEWPEWMPIARVLEYRYLDIAAVQEAITTLVSGLTPEQRTALDTHAPELAGLSAAEVADRFLSLGNGVSLHEIVLPVRQGEGLGSGERSGDEARFAVRARQRAASPYFVNFAYHIAKLRQFGFVADAQVTMAAGAPAAPVSAALVNASGPLIGSGTVLTVAPAGAAHTSVRAAVQAAAPGDLVLITDASTYSSATSIVIDKPLVLTSTSTSDANAAAGLPVLQGVKPSGARNTATWAPAARRAIEVVGRRAGQPTFADGVVQLSNFHVSESAEKYGGGIAIDGCDRVVVENVRFSNNEAFAGGWLNEGFGGGLGARHSGILVKRCVFIGNKANCRGGGLGVFGYGWPIVTDCRFELNQSAGLNVQNPATGKSFLARPDGGAIGIQMATPNAEDHYGEVAHFVQQHKDDSVLELLLAGATELTPHGRTMLAAIVQGTMDPYWDRPSLARSRRSAAIINRCTFTSNTSQDDGGGVYATGLVRLRLHDCLFQGNKADTNGGGLRISTACDAIVVSSRFIENESNAQNRGYQCERKDGIHSWKWITTGGGAVASRTSNLRLVDVEIRFNRANRYAGGGIFFTSTDEGALPGGFKGVKNDWNDVREIIVRCGTGTCPEFRQFSLVIDGGTISDNACGWTGAGTPSPPAPEAACGAPPSDWSARDQLHAKGGGVYALRYVDTDKHKVFPPLSVSISAGTTLVGNTAAFSPTATELFVADLNAPAGAQNPASDTSALTRDTAGVLTAPYRFDSTP